MKCIDDHWQHVWLCNYKLLPFLIPGGLTAVMYTDTAQSIIIVIGAFVVMGLSKLQRSRDVAF